MKFFKRKIFLVHALIILIVLTSCMHLWQRYGGIETVNRYSDIKSYCFLGRYLAALPDCFCEPEAGARQTTRWQRKALIITHFLGVFWFLAVICLGDIKSTFLLSIEPRFEYFGSQWTVVYRCISLVFIRIASFLSKYFFN